MRLVCNALPKTKSGQPAFDSHESIVRWPFYKAMLFMRDQFVGRQMDGSFHSSNPSPVSPSLIPDDEESECSAGPSHQEPVGADKVEPEPPAKKAKIKTPYKKHQITEEFLSLEKEKIANIKKNFEQTSEDDEWTRFTGSLCCDLRKIKDPYLIMRVKTEMTRVVNDVVLQQLSKDNGQQASTSQSVVTAEMYYTDNGFPYHDACRPIL